TANPPTNTIFASGGRVVFNTGDLTSDAITLDGGVQINVGIAPLLGSLDLTDPAVTSLIIAQQQAGNFGGRLRVDASGVAVGGRVGLTPFNLLPVLTAENIPAQVTLRLNGFNANQELLIELSDNSSTPSVVINGVHEFRGRQTSPVMTVTS